MKLKCHRMKHQLAATLLLLGMVALCGQAGAQSVPYEDEPLFSTRFTIADGDERANGQVNKVVRDGDRLYVAGDFDRVEQVSDSGVVTLYELEDFAVLNLNTRKFMPEYYISTDFYGNSGGEIRDMVVDGDTVYIGGEFHTVYNAAGQAYSCSDVARLDLSGTFITAQPLEFNTNSGLSRAYLKGGAVNALTLVPWNYGDTDSLFIGGDFQSVENSSGSSKVNFPHLIVAHVRSDSFILGTQFGGAPKEVTALETDPYRQARFVVGFGGVDSGVPARDCRNLDSYYYCYNFYIPSSSEWQDVFSFGDEPKEKGKVFDIAFSEDSIHLAIGGDANRVVAFNQGNRQGEWLGHTAGGDAQTVAIGDGVVYFSAHDDVTGPSAIDYGEEVTYSTPQYRLGVLDIDDGDLLAPGYNSSIDWDVPQTQTEYWGMWDIDVSYDALILAGSFMEVNRKMIAVTSVQNPAGQVLTDGQGNPLTAADVRVTNPFLNCGSYPGMGNSSTHICDEDYVSRNMGLAIFDR